MGGRFLKFVDRAKTTRFGLLRTEELVLSVEIVPHMYWQGRLIVVCLIEAGFLTNCPKTFFTANFRVEREFDFDPEILLRNERKNWWR